MSKFLKFCPHCKETGNNLNKYETIIKKQQGNAMECLKGYLFLDKISDEEKICPHCGNEIINLNIEKKEYCDVLLISNNNPQVVKPLLKLREEDPIEYQLKFNQLKIQYEQQKAIKKTAKNNKVVEQKNSSDNKITCPKCGSTNITEGTRGFALTTGFVGSGKFRYVCKKCGNKWKPGSMLEILQRGNNRN